MARVLILDSGPLSNCVVSLGTGPASQWTESQRCHHWLRNSEAAGVTIFVPAIAYYEVLREIERRGAQGQRQRLVRFCFQPGRPIHLTTTHFEEAARLWAQARNIGIAMTGDASLDADSILCAQVLSLQLPPTDYVVATTNPKHLTRFVAAEDWQSITV